MALFYPQYSLHILVASLQPKVLMARGLVPADLQVKDEPFLFDAVFTPGTQVVGLGWRFLAGLKRMLRHEKRSQHILVVNILWQRGGPINIQIIWSTYTVLNIFGKWWSTVTRGFFC